MTAPYYVGVYRKTEEETYKRLKKPSLPNHCSEYRKLLLLFFIFYISLYNIA